MVFVTRDWKRFKQYAESCRVGTIQHRDTCEGMEIRVMTGRFGFTKEFKNKDGKLEDEDLRMEIVTFCDIHGYIPFEHSVPDEQFHG